MKIKIKCKGCHKVHDVERTSEIPNDVIHLTCNWCPECSDTATDYYNEEYVYEELIEYNEVVKYNGQIYKFVSNRADGTSVIKDFSLSSRISKKYVVNSNEIESHIKALEA